MELWLATGNRGKLIEFKTLLPNMNIHTQLDLPVYTPPPENGQTFLDNARIKAKSLKAMKPGVWVLGEDSGLEVEGLKNFPGVHSARYAGPKATDPENIAKLLKMTELRTNHNRKAKFRCTIVAFDPTGKEWIIEGEMAGTIASKARGTDGFGYDSVFIPDGESKTLAELGITRKNQISHRAMAIRKLSEVLK